MRSSRSCGVLVGLAMTVAGANGCLGQVAERETGTGSTVVDGADGGNGSANPDARPAGEELGANVSPHAGSVVDVASLDDSIETAALDLSHVYLAGGWGKLWRVDRKSGQVELLDDDTSDQSANSIALDLTHVYWSIHSGRRIKRMNKVTREVELLAADEDGPHDLSLDATSVYWANTGATGGGGVFRMPKAKGPPEPLTQRSYDSWTGAIGGSIYLSGDRTLYRLAGDGGRDLITSNFGAPDAACTTTFDSAHLYWACESWVGGPAVGRLMRVPLTGGEPELAGTIANERLRKLAIVPAGLLYVAEAASAKDPQEGASGKTLLLHRWGAHVDESIQSWSRLDGARSFMSNDTLVTDGRAVYFVEFGTSPSKMVLRTFQL